MHSIYTSISEFLYLNQKKQTTQFGMITYLQRNTIFQAGKL